MPRVKRPLVGEYCYPTATKWHPHEPIKSTAYSPGLYGYLLEGAVPEAYPELVFVTSPEPIEGWTVGTVVQTRHPIAAKQLPDRRVVAIVDAEGKVEGRMIARGLSVAHWERVRSLPDGSYDAASILGVRMRIEQHREEDLRVKGMDR